MGQRRPLRRPEVEAQSIQSGSLEVNSCTEKGQTEWGQRRPLRVWLISSPREGTERWVLHSLSHCACYQIGLHGSLGLSLTLYRSVLQARTFRSGSAGALWGPLQGTLEAEWVDSSGQRKQRLQKQYHSSKKP